MTQIENDCPHKIHFWSQDFIPLYLNLPIMYKNGSRRESIKKIVEKMCPSKSETEFMQQILHMTLG